jgi:hypothetical protein
MIGTAADPGVMVLAFKDLFVQSNQHAVANRVTHKILVSFMEIYNENIFDLLVIIDHHLNNFTSHNYSLAHLPVCLTLQVLPKEEDKPTSIEWKSSGAKEKEDKGLDLREDPVKGPCVTGITEMEVDSAAAVLQLLDSGNAIRHQAATSANAESSRSHAIFCIMVQTRDQAGADDDCK